MDLFCDASEITRRYERHVTDLRRLFVFHGLRCGAPDDLNPVVAKLSDSKAFLTDLSAMVRRIRDLESGSISEDEMLTVIALAIGGERLVEIGGYSPVVANTLGTVRVLLSGMGGWRDSEYVAPAAEIPKPRQNGHASGVLQQAFARAQQLDEGEAAAVPLESGPVATGDDDRLPASPESNSPADLKATQQRLELAIAELKIHLEDIDEKIGRLEPRLHDVPDPLVNTPLPAHERSQNGEDIARQPAPEEEGRDAPAILSREAHRTAREVFARGFEASVAESAPAAPSAAGTETAVDDAGAGVQEELHVDRHSVAPPDRPAVPRAARPEGIGREPPAGAPAGTDGSAASPAEAVPAAEGVVAKSCEAAGRPARLAALLPVGRKAEKLGSKDRRDSPAASTSAKTRKERVGFVLGIAAVILAIVGALALVVSWPSKSKDHEIKEAARATSPASAVTSPAPLPQGKASGEPARNGERSTPSTLERGSSESARPLAAPVETARKANPNGGADPEAEPDSSTPAMTTPLSVRHRRLVLPEATMKARLLSAKRPVYPAEALQQHLAGKVILNAFVAEDGTVRRMDVVGGSAPFVKPAVAAVSWWRYRPYLVEGEPVEVQTQVTLDFPKR